MKAVTCATFSGALTVPKTVNNGDPAPSFAIAAVSLQIDN